MHYYTSHQTPATYYKLQAEGKQTNEAACWGGGKGSSINQIKAGVSNSQPLLRVSFLPQAASRQSVALGRELRPWGPCPPGLSTNTAEAWTSCSPLCPLAFPGQGLKEGPGAWAEQQAWSWLQESPFSTTRRRRSWCSSSAARPWPLSSTLQVSSGGKAHRMASGTAVCRGQNGA